MNSQNHDLLHAFLKQHGTPLLVVDPEIFVHDHARMAASLPGVAHFLALKSVPANQAPLVQALQEKNAQVNLDAASESELRLAARHVPAAQIIFTNPHKTRGMLQALNDCGPVHTVVVDSADEVLKMGEFFQAAAHTAGYIQPLLIRIAFYNKNIISGQFAGKFGLVGSEDERCEQFFQLLALAQQFPFLPVVGVAFHVGTQNPVSTPFVEAIHFCQRLFQQAAQRGIHLSVLDIGGGFPIAYVQRHPFPALEDFCAPINQALQWFKQHNIRLMHEAGRYPINRAGTGLISVIGQQYRGAEYCVSVDSGPGYGLLNTALLEPEAVSYDFVLLEDYCAGGWEKLSPRSFTVFGPSCDSYDTLRAVQLYASRELKLWDVLAVPNLGAYSDTCEAPKFNPQVQAQVVFAKRT